MPGLFDTTSVPDAYERELVGPVFRPWADVLLDYAEVGAGDRVIDVACGTGALARATAERVGATGQVLATDISLGMLAIAGTSDARIETLLASAEDLAGAPEDFDVALCQQGFQFLPDRVVAARAMRRVVRERGRIAVAVWLTGPTLEPFDLYGLALQACGVPEPFPRAYAYDFSISVDELTSIFLEAGLGSVEVTCRELELTRPSLEQAVRGIAGTPYGPSAAALPPDQQSQLNRELRSRLRSPFPMTSVLARGSVQRHR